VSYPFRPLLGRMAGDNLDIVAKANPGTLCGPAL
jgi:hypothetical protein